MKSKPNRQKTRQPNPGSDEAIKKGCLCPVLDNGHGNEELGKMRGFWINDGCPLHGGKRENQDGDRLSVLQVG
ncbi:MAG: hypothetical protein M0R00_06725 [Candidatus Omnitrophica bacterium]|jgi:hypothetical protein|nr:hypothetical protein [Candidatus Omnitrophota bacterium]